MIKYIAFDGGDTLIKVYPEFSGPMYTWPQVDAVSGVHEALESLSKQYSLIVITNAVESDASQVRAAMKRCDLDSYFDHIFTAKELNYSKPQPEIFHCIERTLNICPRNIAMIGDSFVHDISGAFRVGWKSIWFNPKHDLCPGLIPFHTGEINRMEELSEQIDHLKLPELDQCFALLAEHGASFNIFQHVQAVASVAYVLANQLKKRGIQVDPVLAHRGGLLHDLAKLHEIPGSTKNHGEMAADILRKLDQPVLAAIAQKHLLSNILDKNHKPKTWEERIVYLADKLVEGSNIVPIEERLSALKQRYGIGSLYDIPLREMQENLCSKLGISPPQLVDTIRDALYSGRIFMGRP